MKKWTAAEIPSLQNKFAIVTGGTDGIGFETARELALHGASVVIAADHGDKGALAVQKVRHESPTAKIRFERLDTSDLESVRDFAQRIPERTIDILVNNAGITAVMKRRESIQGYEWNLAANFLGHFALTAKLFTRIMKSSDPRIVNLASLSHTSAHINFADLQSTKNYDAAGAYGQSKLAMLLFARELDKRARAGGLSLKAIPVHPGGARTNIFAHGKQKSNTSWNPFPVHYSSVVIALMGQSAHAGALPSLFAATSADAKSGVYYGPDGFQEIRGNPAPAKIKGEGLDMEIASKLWDVAEELTGILFPVEKARSGLENSFSVASEATTR